ncbi:MAG TPA: diguanylate cyclase [Methanocorpusculum sp.]|nr:diguanylate cyclase [Methanocorpusculum sp.]
MPDKNPPKQTKPDKQTGPAAELHTILNHTKTGAWIMDVEDGALVRMHCDDTMLDLMGAPRDLTPEENLAFLFAHTDKAYLAGLGQYGENMLAGNHAEIEYPYYHPVRGKIFVRCSGAKSPAPGPVRLEGIHREITELVHVERETTSKGALTVADYLNENYVSAYYINLTDLTLQIYRRNEYLAEKYADINNYLETINIYINTDVHESDRAELRHLIDPGRIKETLSLTPQYSHIFRDISGGTLKWYRMDLSRGGDEDHAAMTFLDITESIRKNKENTDLIEILTAEYTGVIRVDLRENSITPIRIPAGIEEFLGNVDFNKTLPLDFISSVFINAIVLETDKEKMRRFANRDHIIAGFAQNDVLSETYLSTFGGPVHYWELRLNILHREDGEPVSFLASFRDIDKEVRAQKMEVSDSMSLLQTLSDTYESLYYINPDNGSYQLFTPGRGFGLIASDEFINTNDFFKDTCVNLDEVCHENDIDRVKAFYTPENLASVLADGKIVTIEHRLILNGKTCWYQNKVVQITDRQGNKRYVIGVVNITQQKELECNAARDNDVMTALASEYNSVFLINLKRNKVVHKITDSLSMETAGALINGAENYTTSMECFVHEFVAPADQERLLAASSIENLRAKLAEQKSYYVTFRTIENGEPVYAKMNFVRVDEAGTAPGSVVNKVAIGIADADREITYRYAAESIMESYISVFICNMETESMKPVKTFAGYKPQEAFRPVDSFFERVREYMQIIEPAYLAGWEQLTRRESMLLYLRDSDIREKLFKITTDKVHPWRKAVIHVLERNEKKEAVTCLLLFTIPDTDGPKQLLQAEKVAEQYSVISKLAESYECVNFVSLTENPETDEAVNYRLHPVFSAMCPAWAGEMQFTKKLDLLINEIADERDRLRLREKTRRSYILQKLVDKGEYAVSFRVKEEGGVHYYQLKFCGFVVDGKIKSIVMGIKSIDTERKRADERMKELAVLTELTEDFELVTYTDMHLDMDKDVLTTFRISPDLKALMPDWGETDNVSDNFSMIMDNIVYEPDREKFRIESDRALILQKLMEDSAYYVNFRVADEFGEISYYQMKYTAYKKDTFIKGLIMGMHSVDAETKNKLAMQKKLETMVAERTLELREKNRVLNRMNDDIVELLGDLIESRDGDSGEHIRRVKGFTHILARQVMKDLPEYGLTREKINLMTSASALHDVGKINIPDKILLKPGKLTAEEFGIMKTHCEKGCGILDKAPLEWSPEYLDVSRKICRYHHEKWDGKGYPEGLKGDEIPIEAQIVSIADIFDALISDRCYKSAYTCKEAGRMIKDGECGAFSDKLLACFERCLDAFTAYAKDVKRSKAAAMHDIEFAGDREGHIQEAAALNASECTLPGVSDAAAYAKRARELNLLIDAKTCPGFAVIECDMNSLKLINSTYNWEVGDRYLMECVGIISDIFCYSSIYRVGGDEFIIIVEGEDYLRVETLTAALREAGSSMPHEENMPDNSFAVGMAVFDPDCDKALDDVFARADADMQANKPEKPASPEEESGDVSVGLSVQLISLLSEDFQALYFIDAVSGRFRLSVNTKRSNADVFLNELGASDDFYVNIRADILNFVVPEDKNAFKEFFSREKLINMQAVSESATLVSRWMINDMLYWIRSRIVPARAANGAKRLVLGVTDITREIDITRMHQRQIGALRACISSLDTKKNVKSAVKSLLKVVGDYYSADRVHEFECDEKAGRIVCSAMWLADGIAPHMKLDSELPYSALLTHLPVFAEKGYAWYHTPEEAAPEMREKMLKDGIESIALAPVYADGILVGVIGIENPRESIEDLFLLRGVAAVLHTNIINRIGEEEKVRAAEIDRAFLERAIISEAYSYIKVNLSQNRILPPIMERVDGRLQDVTKMIAEPLPAYDTAIVNVATHYAAAADKEKYIQEMSSASLIAKFNQGETMPEFVCEMDSARFGWQVRRYLTYLSRDAMSGDIFALSVAYDITERERLKKERKIFENEIQKREEKLEYVSELAMRDSLTHVGSVASFREKSKTVNAAIADGSIKPFAIVECDLNSLKLVNDTFGHEAGNEYIQRCCSEICRVFRHSPVYRVGGDEFIVYLEGSDFTNRAVLLKSVHDLAEYEVKKDAFAYTKISFASGMADFVPGADKALEDVYKRADAAMYEHKVYLKGL